MRGLKIPRLEGKWLHEAPIVVTCPDCRRIRLSTGRKTLSETVWCEVRNGQLELNPDLEHERVKVNIGAFQTVTIDKMYGPSALNPIRIHLDFDKGEWVVDEPSNHNNGWTEACRISGQGEAKVQHCANCTCSSCLVRMLTGSEHGRAQVITQELEHVRAENARMRAALDVIIKNADYIARGGVTHLSRENLMADMARQARAALGYNRDE